MNKPIENPRSRQETRSLMTSPEFWGQVFARLTPEEVVTQRLQYGIGRATLKEIGFTNEPGKNDAEEASRIHTALGSVMLPAGSSAHIEVPSAYRDAYLSGYYGGTPHAPTPDGQPPVPGHIAPDHLAVA